MVKMCPHVPTSPSPRVPESPRPHVPESPRPRVPESPRPRVPTSHVPVPLLVTAEYQHATKDANFSAQESLDERRRYVLSPHCLFREETFHASNKHDSWNIRNKVRTIVLLSWVSRYCARALKDVCKFPCVCFTLEVI